MGVFDLWFPSISSWQGIFGHLCNRINDNKAFGGFARTKVVTYKILILFSKILLFIEELILLTLYRGSNPRGALFCSEAK